MTKTPLTYTYIGNRTAITISASFDTLWGFKSKEAVILKSNLQPSV